MNSNNILKLLVLLYFLLVIRYIVTMVQPSLLACPSLLTTTSCQLISILEAPRITQKLFLHHTLTRAPP